MKRRPEQALDTNRYQRFATDLRVMEHLRLGKLRGKVKLLLGGPICNICVITFMTRHYLTRRCLTRHHLTRARVLVAAVLLLLAADNAPAQFEGIIETANVSTDEYGRAVTFTMTMWVAPVGVRIGIPATGDNPGVTIIGRTDRAVRWVLNEGEKTYFELPVQAALEDEGPAPRAPAFERTGKKKKILGYSAEQLVLKEGSVRTEIWATRELRPLVETLDRALGGGEMEGGSAWSNELTGLGLFPLRALTRDGKDVLESSDVTRIRRVHVDPALLDLPAGYTRQGVRDVIREETAPGP